MKTDGLSINLATVRQQFGLKDGIEACLKHGITAISPWRDHVQSTGVDEAARIIKSNGIKVTGYCRGGLFPATDAAGRQAAIDRDGIPVLPVGRHRTSRRRAESMLGSVLSRRAAHDAGRVQAVDPRPAGLVQQLHGRLLRV